MLKEQRIINTWKCDSCGVELISDVNPYFKVSINIAALPNSTICEIDLCKLCVPMITVQSVTDYVLSVELIP